MASKILKIFKAFDFRGNKIINAKVDTPTDPKHIVNKEYADNVNVYDTEKATTYSNPFQFPLIINTLGKSFKDLFDDLFFPLIQPIYTNPKLSYYKFLFPNNDIIQVTNIRSKYLLYYNQLVKLDFEYYVNTNDRSATNLAYLEITNPIDSSIQYFYEEAISSGKVSAEFILLPNLIYKFKQEFGVSNSTKQNSYNEAYIDPEFELNYLLEKDITSEILKYSILSDSFLISTIRTEEKIPTYIVDDISNEFLIKNDINFNAGTEGIFDILIPEETIKILEVSDILLHAEISKFKNVLSLESHLNVKNGAYYNKYAVTDVRNIANIGWRVSTNNDWSNLASPEGLITGAGKLKETGTTYFQTPNTGATNTSKFNARAGGARGYFFSNTTGYWWTNDLEVNDNFKTISYNSTAIGSGKWAPWYGFNVRLVKTITNLTEGQSGFYIGNDGKKYDTICINGVEWLAENLCETKYNNGDLINIGPTEGTIYNDIEWPALLTGAMSWHNSIQDQSYAYENLPIIKIVNQKVDNKLLYQDWINNYTKLLEGETLNDTSKILYNNIIYKKFQFNFGVFDSDMLIKLNFKKP